MSVVGISKKPIVIVKWLVVGNFSNVSQLYQFILGEVAIPTSVDTPQTSIEDPPVRISGLFRLRHPDRAANQWGCTVLPDI